MSIRRRLVSAVCLLSVGTVVAVGQQKNSVTETGSVYKKSLGDSEVSQGRSLREAEGNHRSIEYFSPKVTEPTRVDLGIRRETAEAAAGSAPVRRERMKTAGTGVSPAALPTPTLAATAAAAPATPAATAPAVTAVPAPVPVAAVTSAIPEVSLFEASASPSAPASTQETGVVAASSSALPPAAFAEQVTDAAPDDGSVDGSEIFQVVDEAASVRTAEFSPEDHQQAPIAQVSRREVPVTGTTADANPFADFLGDEPTASAVQLPVVPSRAAASPAAEPASQTPGGRTGLTATVESVRVPGTTASESGPQSPGVTLQWIQHGEFNVGQPCHVELVVENSTRTMAQNVVAEAEIPSGLEVVSFSPEPSDGNSSPRWNFGSLKPGEKKSVALKVVPQQRGELQLSAFVRLTGASSSTLTVQEPLITIAVNGPEQLEVGQQSNYVVRVSNPGTGTATNVLIQAVLPDGLQHRRGSLLTVEIGTLNPGESRQAQLNLTAVHGGTHQLAIRAVADGGLADQAAAAVSIAEPRLQVSLEGAAEQAAGRSETYRLRVTNDGGVPSANVRAKYRVPEGCGFISANRGGKYHESDRSIEWFVGTLQSGESSQFEVTLQSLSTGKMLHQAGVISENGKVTMAEHLVTVEGTAVLELQLAANQRQVTVGDEVTFEVQVANTGSRTASNVGISCELPAGLQLLRAAGPSEHIAENGILIFRSLPQIEAGRPVKYSIVTRCTRDGSHRLRLRVASESISEAVIGEESVASSAR